MARTTFDELMETAKDAGYGPDELLTPGTYDAEVVATNTKVSAKGKRQFGAKFKIIGGPHDGSGVWHNMYVSPESATALSILFRDLAALGADKEFLKGLSIDDDGDAQIVADQIMGAVVRIRVETENQPGYDEKSKVARITASARATTRTTESRATTRTEKPASPF